MKKMYIKYKILVNGPSLVETYTLDGFTMKKGNFDDYIFYKIK